ncbi:MAG: hypothetical protein Aurels2KO_05750 [Aureliella sp.]
MDARKLVRWRAVVQAITLLAACILALTLLDVWLHREEVGLRVLAAGIVLAVATATYFRILRPAWRFKASRSDVAQWVDNSSKSTKLAEAVQLAEKFQNDNLLQNGSSGFLVAALQQWHEQNATPKWRDHLDSKSLRRCIILLAVILLLTGVAFAVAPNEMRRAFARLASPLSATPWPLADELALAQPPAVVALGEAIQLEIVDKRPPLPEQTDLMVRPVASESAQQAAQRIPAALIGDIAIANLRPLTAAVEVRPVGGEDRGGRWHRIDVIRPPDMADYEFEIVPPEYTKLPPERVTGRRIGVVAGSKVKLSGAFDADLSGLGAQFQFAPADQALQNESLDWQTTWKSSLDSNRRQFTVGTQAGRPAEVLASMRWQFVLATQDGLTVLLPEVWSIEAKPDKPPVVSAQPTRLSSVTANGKVQFSGQASDDFGLASLTLIVAPGESEYRETIADYNDPASQKSASFTHTLAIDDLPNAMQATATRQLEVFIEGVDALGQATRVPVQKLVVRKPEAVLAELVKEQTAINDQLSDIVRLQADSWQRLDRVATQIVSSDEFQQTDASELERIARTQIDVLRQLDSKDVGLQNRITEALDSLRLNGLDQQHGVPTSLQKQLSDMLDRVSELSQQNAVTAADNTSQMSATAARNVAEDRGLDRQLERQIELSQESSQSLLSELELLQSQVARSQATRQLASDLRNIVQQQKALRKETDRVQLESLGRNASGTYDQQLRQLTLDQVALADNLNSLLDRAERLTSRQPKDESVDVAQQQESMELERAARQVREQRIASTMQRAGAQLQEENFADAANSQIQTIESLEQALGISPDGVPTIAGELEQLADKARIQAHQLRQMASGQEAISEEFKRASVDDGTLEEIARGQDDLRAQTEQIAEQAISSGQGELADLLDDATEEQSQASKTAASNPGLASDFARKAADELKRSANWLDNRADVLADQLRRQQSLSLGEQLDALVKTQTDIVFQIQFTSSSEDADQDSIVISQQLRAQHQSVARTRRTIDQLPTFAWALEQVERSLDKAIAASQRQRLIPDAERASETALRWLKQAALAIQSVENESQAAGEGTDTRSTSDEDASDAQPSLASIKLLRALQSQIRLETVRLQANPASIERSRGLASLASEQEALGRQLGQLLERAGQ